MVGPRFEPRFSPGRALAGAGSDWPGRVDGDVFRQNGLKGGRAVAKIFVTGGTGFIGRPVVAELLGAGHEVMGLARTAESTQALEKADAVMETLSVQAA